jgi:glycosyltransferase involved in cell wall biosynthesis
LGALSAARSAGADCIVVDDGSTDATASIARQFGAALLSTGGRKGPAHARNIGAGASQAEILWFVDADVCVHDDAMERLLAHFCAEPDLAAVIGAYHD